MTDKIQFLLPRFYMTDNTLKNRAKLIPGYQYLIFYRDYHIGTQKVVAAVWNSKKIEPDDFEGATLDKLNLFDFCGYKFVNEEVRPSFVEREDCHYILAWCDLRACGVSNEVGFEERLDLDKHRCDLEKDPLECY